MLKPNCAWDRLKSVLGSGVGVRGSCPEPRTQNPERIWRAVYLSTLLATGCATPQYAIRGTPVPDESAAAVHIERQISAYQAQEFEQQGARPIGPIEEVRGFAVQQIVDRLSRVTERQSLHYRAYLYPDRDPNAAALADGRIYLSAGLLNYLAGRGSRSDELAFIIGHELAHTVAQHLVKRYRTLQQQQLLVSLVAAGASVATRNASEGAQQAGQFAVDIASLLRDVAISGYSQEQELEADQLGIRYMMRAGFNPHAALELLEDFAKFDRPAGLLRTHPSTLQRREDVRRYLSELESPASMPQESSGASEASTQIRRLRETQKLYPTDSVSWKNLQRQIDALGSDPVR